jgi:hypothetical protein
MTTAARAAYAPCRPVWRLSPPANHPLRRKGGGIGGALSIITKSSPDNHLRIEADASELEPVDRPEFVRATVRPAAAAVWLHATALKPCPHLSNVAPSQRCTSPVASRGGVIEEQRLAFRVA